MRIKAKLFGIIAILAVIGLLFAGCGGSGGDPATPGGSDDPNTPGGSGGGGGGGYVGGGSKPSSPTTPETPTLTAYTVTFDLDGGTDNGGDAGQQAVFSGQNIVVPTDVRKTDFTLVGWFVGTQEYTAAGPAITQAVTIKALWSDSSKKFLKFVTNGGSVIAPQINLDTGYSIEKPANPTRTGFTFVDWYKDPDLAVGNLIAASAWPMTDVDTNTDSGVIYAKWTHEPWNITFLPNDARVLGAGTKYLTILEDDETLTGQSLYAPDDYSVAIDALWNSVEWYEKQDLSGPPIVANTTVFSGPTTVYGKWTGEAFDVIFKKGTASGAAGSDTTISVEYPNFLTQADFDEALAAITRPGYTVGAWNTGNADGSKTMETTGVNARDPLLDVTLTSVVKDNTAFASVYPVWEEGPAGATLSALASYEAARTDDTVAILPVTPPATPVGVVVEYSIVKAADDTLADTAIAALAAADYQTASGTVNTDYTLATVAASDPAPAHLTFKGTGITAGETYYVVARSKIMAGYQAGAPVKIQLKAKLAALDIAAASVTILADSGDTSGEPAIISANGTTIDPPAGANDPQLIEYAMSTGNDTVPTAPEAWLTATAGAVTIGGGKVSFTKSWDAVAKTYSVDLATGDYFVHARAKGDNNYMAGSPEVSTAAIAIVLGTP